MENNYCDSEREHYERIMAKQDKIGRKILLIMFLSIGVIMLLLGLIFALFGIKDEDGFDVFIVFIGMGAIFIILGVVFWIWSVASPPNYEKYKKNIERHGGINFIDIAVALELSKEKIAELENRITALEKEKNIENQK